MNDFLYSLIKDPITKDALTLHIFDNKKEDGIFINKNTQAIYPIIGGVPVMLNDSIPVAFYKAYKQEMLKYINISIRIEAQVEKASQPYSFSQEWKEFEEGNQTKTWGMTTEDRLLQFYLETNSSEESIKGKVVLDAGCGNGLLTAELARKGCIIVGMDFSESVWPAARRTQDPNIIFIRGDLQNPPFAVETFDIIISNGVLHHTKNTRHTFMEVSKLVMSGGKFYVWLYRRNFTLYFKTFIKITDGLRFVISRMPHGVQKICVKLYANFFYYLKLWRNRKMDYDQLLIDSYDILTPTYKHYHHPLEVAEWFYDSGFQAPILSHWDNPYGFGIMAIKTKMDDTPGFNFKSEKIQKRYANI